MTESQSPDLPRRLLTELCRLVAERAAVEQQVHTDFSQQNETAESEFREAERLLSEDYRTRKAAVEQEFASTRTATETKFQSEHEALEKAYEAAKEKIAAQFVADQQAAEQAQQDAHWEAIEASEAARGGMNIPLKEVLAGLESRWQQLETIHQQAVDLLRDRGHWDDVPETPPVAVLLEKHPGRRFYHALEVTQNQLRDLQQRHFWSSLYRGVRPVGIFLLVCLLTCYPSFLIFGKDNLQWAAVSRRRDRRDRQHCGWPSGATTSPNGDPSTSILLCGTPCSKPGWATRRCWKRPRPTASGWMPPSTPATRPSRTRPIRSMPPPRPASKSGVRSTRSGPIASSPADWPN